MKVQSEAFKEAAVRKLLNRGSKRVIDVADELGVSTITLYNWSKQYAINKDMKKIGKRPQDWSPEEKFNAVMEYDRLSEGEKGEFLRKQGLHSDHIAIWKKRMQLGLEQETSEPRSSKSESTEDKQRIKELERELNRKEKALAETAALLVLKKKADSIWGNGEDE